MAVNSVRSPFPAFLDTDGNALESGKIYIGTISTNPITNAKQVYWDEAQTITADQPIRTIGGLPVRNGSLLTIVAIGNARWMIESEVGTWSIT